tara:strand:- start:205 stop:363 length:159 start_codon:yes stop_codon:yes gene_type:complete
MVFEHCGGHNEICLASKDERFTHLAALDFETKGKSKYEENAFPRNVPLRLNG